MPNDADNRTLRRLRSLEDWLEHATYIHARAGNRRRARETQRRLAVLRQRIALEVTRQGTARERADRTSESC